MNPERRQKIESVFNQALGVDPGHRGSVLEDLCAGDESLRREVESLLAQREKTGGPNERPTFAGPAEPVHPRHRSGDSNSSGIPAGMALGHFRIVGKIGSGGMGVVYEAEDLKLRRHVALKFLPEEVAENPQALQRFRQEARAASALSHPNICTIYEVDEVDGRVFIAMELLEGQTLKQTISSKPLPLETVIDFGVQIAGAISAAHSKGIVHRDIKPANIFVLRQRRIKVLDFGLAKLTRSAANSDETELTDGTEPGMVMGTVGYMSPEQVRGQAVDGRTDIFALGAILYEMLTGRRAFEKPTASETMAAILNEESAAISGIAPRTPPALTRVICRCLEKEPEQRFQSASDLAFALQALAEASGPAATAVGQGSSSRQSWKWTGIAAGAMVALGAFAVIWWRTPPKVPMVVSVTQLTNDGEPKSGAVTFTDGSRIYFNEGPPGGWKIAQVSVNGGPTAWVETSVHNPQLLGLARDGSAALVATAAQSLGTASRGPLWSIPLPAGEPRRLGDFEGELGGAEYLSNGRLFVTQGNTAIVADLDGGNPQKLASFSGNPFSPSISPDGRRIVASLGSSFGDLSMVEIGSDGKGMRSLKVTPPACCGVWTPDGKYLLYELLGATTSNISAISMKEGLFGWSGRPIQLTAGPLSYSQISVTRDGKQVFAVGATDRGELVRYDLKSHEFVPFLSGISALEPSFSGDGQWVAYQSFPDGNLWRSRSDGSEKMQLTFPPIHVAVPHLSPDGTKVAFTTDTTDEVMVVDMDARRPPRSIAKGGFAAWAQAGNWSPDGNLLLLEINGEIALYDMRTGGMSVVPSSKDMTGYWIDQNNIVGLSPDKAKFLTFDVRTQKWTDLATVNATGIWQVSPDFRYVYYETGGEEAKAWRLRFADRKIEMLTSLQEASRARSLGWVGDINAAPDGSPIFTRNIGTQEIYALNVRWPK